MKCRAVFFFCLVFPAVSFADFTSYCNWAVMVEPLPSKTATLRNSSPVGCVLAEMLRTPDKAHPPACPENYQQFGKVQGGMVGAISDKVFLFEARRICLKI